MLVPLLALAKANLTPPARRSASRATTWPPRQRPPDASPASAAAPTVAVRSDPGPAGSTPPLLTLANGEMTMASAAVAGPVAPVRQLSQPVPRQAASIDERLVSCPRHHQMRLDSALPNELHGPYPLKRSSASR